MAWNNSFNVYYFLKAVVPLREMRKNIFLLLNESKTVQMRTAEKFCTELKTQCGWKWLSRRVTTSLYIHYTHIIKIIKDLKLEMAKFTQRLEYYHKIFFFYLYVLSFEFGRSLHTCIQAYHLPVLYVMCVWITIIYIYQSYFDLT